VKAISLSPFVVKFDARDQRVLAPHYQKRQGINKEIQHSHWLSRAHINRMKGKHCSSIISRLTDMSSPVTASDSSSPAPLEDIKPISTSTAADVALSSEVESKSRARTAKKKAAPAVGVSRAKRTTTGKAKTSITGKATTTKAKPRTKAKPATKKVAASKAAASGRPSWKDIIKECIVTNKEDARVGVSRTTIKKVSCLCV